MSAPIEDSKNSNELPVPPNVIAELKAKHNVEELRLYQAADEFVICKSPSRGDYKRFKQDINDPARRTVAVEQFFLSAVVYPDKDEVFRMLERKPALADVFGDKISEWIGAGVAASEKKL